MILTIKSLKSILDRFPDNSIVYIEHLKENASDSIEIMENTLDTTDALPAYSYCYEPKYNRITILHDY